MKFAHKKCHDILFCLVIGACFVLFVCTALSGDDTSLNTPVKFTEQNSSNVIVTDIDNQTIYSISDEDCKIEWIVRNSEKSVISHRARCEYPLSRQLPLLAQICMEFFGKDKNARAFRTLFWGRLTPDGSKPPSQELSLRLALAAHKSPGWDVKRGKPRNGDINGFVKDLANRADIYPELKELFKFFHKSIKFSCAEKVLVLKAEKLPFFDELKKHGIKASDRLPFDCMTWFSISEMIQSK